MLVDKYGQIVYSENDLLELYLTNPEISFSRPIIAEREITFSNDLDLDKTPKVNK